VRTLCRTLREDFLLRELSRLFAERERVMHDGYNKQWRVRRSRKESSPQPPEDVTYAYLISGHS